MKKQRQRYGADFKTRVALEAIKGERTLNEIATDYKVHPNQIPKWKKRAIEFVASGFSGELTARAEDDDRIKDQLYQQIGQLKVELDWLKKKIRTVELR